MENKQFLEIHESVNTIVKATLFYNVELNNSFQSYLTNGFSGVSGVEGLIDVVTKIYGYVKSSFNIDLIEHSYNVLASKDKEYSAKGDRLYNFKTDYSFMLPDPKQNLFGFVRKHLVSVMDIINGVKKDPDDQFIIEHFGDVYNYGILLIALLEED